MPLDLSASKIVLPSGAVVEKKMTPSDVHVDRPLTNVSVAYMQNQNLFRADTLFPRVPVQKQSDQYWVYDRSYWNRLEMRPRPPSTETAGGRMRVSTDSYFCEVYGVHFDIDDRVVANADSPLAPRRDATNWISMQALLMRELSWTGNFFKTGVWGIDITGVAAAPTGDQMLQWNDAGSDPIADVTAWKTRMHLATGGFPPNVMVMSQEVWDVLKTNGTILDRLKYGQTGPSPAQVTRQAVAALFEIDRIEVLAAVYNTGEEEATPTGAHGTNETNAFVAGKHVALFYVPSSPGLLTPAAGYTYVWNGYLGASNGQRVSSFRMDHIKSDRVEIEMAFDQKVVGADCGLFVDGAIA